VKKSNDFIDDFIESETRKGEIGANNVALHRENAGSR
jgi:hypothetical protein